MYHLKEHSIIYISKKFLNWLKYGQIITRTNVQLKLIWQIDAFSLESHKTEAVKNNHLN